MSIDNNGLTDIPTELSPLTGLTALSFAGNPFAEFPTAICTFTFLEELHEHHLFLSLHHHRCFVIC